MAAVAVGSYGRPARADLGLTTLVTFTGTANGANPYAGLTADAAGNLYGTTRYGGSSNNDGTVFELAAGTHAMSTLTTFVGTTNGANPYGGVTPDSTGNLYGTTSSGGSGSLGIAFEVAAGTHAFSTLATFTAAGTSGYIPSAGLTADATANLYGTTLGGGANGGGAVFELAAGTHTPSTVAAFSGTTGARAAVTFDSGNLYGTTSGGTASDGTVFEVAAGTHVATPLVTFTGTANGANPYGNLVADGSGNLYGTTNAGGSAANDGTVFEVAAGTHALTTLATFTGTANGANPYAGLTIDSAGNLFGTTYSGGSANDGTVFEVAAGTRAFSTLLTFTGTANGANPQAGLLPDAAGNLYGTTSAGGTGGDGTVFEITGFVAAPEPGSATLSALAGLGLASVRRRRRVC